jgi:carboxymethylenebutenolidase
MSDLTEPSTLGPAMPLTRRRLIKASLGVGFCAAVTPVAGQAITTSSDGLIAGEVKVPAGGVDIPAYRAMPDRGGPFPVVPVGHEIFGVHEYIKDICRRFARLGYFAIAPDLFARQGDAAAEPNPDRLYLRIVLKTPDSEAISDLDATLAYAKSTGSADVARAAMVGFCWGGRMVWLYCAHNPGLRAGVAWYGPLTYGEAPLQPTNPPDIVSSLKVPTLALYGALDRLIPLDQIEAMKAKLAAAGAESKIVVYDDADHAFFSDYRTNYMRADAEASWAEATRWLTAHGF